jgi:hypothetical protein
MSDENDQLEPLQARISLLEELLRQVPLTWARCRLEGSFAIGEPGTASYEFLTLLLQINRTVPPIESQESPP